MRVVGTGAMAVALVAALLFVGAAPVGAACAPVTPEDALATTPVVFVGTVTATTNDGRWATVRVDEVWRGGPMPAEVEVRGGGESGTATLTDRVFGPLRYLFFVRSAGGPVYTDDGCSATTVWRDDLASLRPRGAVVNEPLLAVGGVDLAPLYPVAALAALLVIVVVAYGLVWRARRRPPDWVR